MATTTRNSGTYTNVYVNKYLVKAQDRGARILPFRFSHTVISGETGGASSGVSDVVNLLVIPANWMVVAMFFRSDNLWASAAVNGTLSIGDSGQVDRYLLATELYTASASGGGPIATEGDKNGRLTFSGQNYVPTVDTIVFAKYAVAAPTVGKTFRGIFLLAAPE